jgi:DNA-binding CsgD family transcriptional regulator
MREVDFVEACYRIDADTDNWAARLCGIAEEFFPRDLGTAMFAYEIQPGWRITSPWTVMTERGRTAAATDRRPPTNMLPAVTPTKLCDERTIRTVYATASPRVVAVSQYPVAMRALTRAALPPAGRDATGLFASVDGRGGVILGSLAPDNVRLGSGRRAHLTLLCEHLAAGFAVRKHVAAEQTALEERAAAVLSTDGRMLDADESARAPATRAQLSEAIKRIDQARCRRRKSSPAEALDLWRAFVAGSYALVESWDRGGRRFVLAVRVRTGPRALTPRETTVARLVALGLSNKTIAARLGLATGTVGAHVSAVLKKLGYLRRADLIGRLSAYTSDRADDESRAH